MRFLGSSRVRLALACIALLLLAVYASSAATYSPMIMGWSSSGTCNCTDGANGTPGDPGPAGPPGYCDYSIIDPLILGNTSRAIDASGLNDTATYSATLSTVNSWFTSNGSVWQSAVLAVVNGWFTSNNSATQAATLSVVSDWFVSNLSTRVTGPSVATVDNITVFGAATGKEIKDSKVQIGGDRNISPVNWLFADNIKNGTGNSHLDLWATQVDFNANAVFGPTKILFVNYIKNITEYTPVAFPYNVSLQFPALVGTDAVNKSYVDSIAGGLNDSVVSGPWSSTTDNIATFASATGRVIKDSGHALSEYALTSALAAYDTISNVSAHKVEGVAVSVSGNLLSFADTGGHLIADSGYSPASIISSSVNLAILPSSRNITLLTMKNGSGYSNQSRLVMTCNIYGNCTVGTNITVFTGAEGYRGPSSLELSGGNITGLASPAKDTDAATKGYVDTAVAGAGGGGGGTTVNRSLLVSSGAAPGSTFTLTSSTKYIVVEVLGGGGGSGGNTGAASNGAYSGAGGAGGYAIATLPVSGSAILTYNIGPGGAGGASGANPGAAGYRTNISGSGWWINCTGGGGGTGQAYGTTVARVAGGVGGTCFNSGISVYNMTYGMNMTGDNGQRFSATTGVPAAGADSPYGQGGIARTAVGAGVQGIGYGVGAAGTYSTSTAYAGAAGRAGLIIITEYS